MWAPGAVALPPPPAPTLGTLPSPPAHCLPDPSYRRPTQAPTPYASTPDSHQPPKNSSTHYHQPSVPHSWGGALVKSNPIIRHSAVQEKKENFPLVNSRLPFFFPPLPSFHPKWGQDDTSGPLGQLSLSLFGLDLSFLPFSRSLVSCFFFSGIRLPLCWVLGH